MSERDKEIIAKHSSGSHASLVYNMAQRHGGIDRIENDKYIFADGFAMCIRQRSMFERWAEEEKNRPADWLEILD
jgi:hypothetical protein